jgi:hypothetical protein
MNASAYMVAVEPPQNTTESASIATAAAYLAYADRSDTFGYAPNIEKVVCWETKEGKPIVDFTFEPMIGLGDDSMHERFLHEMAQLSRVLTVERVR